MFFYPSRTHCRLLNFLGVKFQCGDNRHRSAQYLKTFVHDFSSDPRRADGVVKLARALTEIGEEGQACQYLDRIPDLPAASVTDRTRDAAAVQRRNAGCS